MLRTLALFSPRASFPGRLAYPLPRERLRAPDNALISPRVASLSAPWLSFPNQSLAAYCTATAARGAPRKKRRATGMYLNKKEKSRKKMLSKLSDTPIDLPEFISAKGLSRLLGVRTVDVLKLLIRLGTVPRTSDEFLPPETDFKRVPNRKVKDMDIRPRKLSTAEDKFPSRPPVIVILGHVNHGKTTLLDTLRKSRRADTEAGGITQHMGAFLAKAGKSDLTFLDTPGHAAFESMRERGATGADIVVLVVDAERGVQEQTRTSIAYAKKYNLPTIVALNKIDKKAARPKKVTKELEEAGLALEENGGNVPIVHVSATTGTGIDVLKETILLQSGLLDLKADRNGPPEVTILESRLDKHRGLVASGIVRCGTLKKGLSFVCGIAEGKVRWLFDGEGKQAKEILPGYPAEITGFESKSDADLPQPGDVLICVEDEKKIRDVITYRTKIRQEKERSVSSVKLQDARLESEDEVNSLRLEALEGGLNPEEYITKHLAEKAKSALPTVSFVVKGDVAGSVEAVTSWLESLPRAELDIRVVRSSVGVVTENDIKLASQMNERGVDNGADKPVILCFGVGAGGEQVRSLAAQNGVTIVSYPIIYSLMDWVVDHCSKLLPPTIVTEDKASCTILQVFSITQNGEKVKVAGCSVNKGKVRRGADVVVRHEDAVVFTGKIRQLRHLKEEVKEISAGKECGIMFSDSWSNFEAGDIITVIEKREVPKKFFAHGTYTDTS